MKRGWALAAALVAACHRPLPPPQEPGRAVLLLSADLRGYLGPCGCSERMRGGIGRAAAVLEELRRQGAPVAFVDGGDALFEGIPLSPQEVPEAERRAQALAEAFRLMGLQAKAVGPRDDARGESLRRRLGLPELPNPGGRLLSLGGHRVGLVAGAQGQELASAAARARRDGAELVVGFLAQPLEVAQTAAQTLAGSVDLLVASHGDALSAEDNRLVRGAGPGAVPVAQLQSKGRSLLRLDVAFGGAPGQPFTLLKTPEDVSQEAAGLDARLALLGREIDTPGLQEARRRLLSAKMDELVIRRARLLSAPPGAAQAPSLAARFIPLESSLPSDPKVQAVVERFDVDVGRLNLAWAKAHGHDCPAPTAAEPGFVGTAACVECHDEAGAFWSGTKHAHAYATLEQAGKQFATACIGCHVTGYGQPGGVCRVDHVAERVNVGCESCHGPGSAHAQEPSDDNIIARPGETRCVTCHTAERSPHFDFALYQPRILGPGHGRPGK